MKNIKLITRVLNLTSYDAEFKTICVCSNYASCYAVAVYLCCQYTPGARDQGTAALLAELLHEGGLGHEKFICRALTHTQIPS